MLTVNHLTTGYGKKQVLTDVSFHINAGEIVLLIGGNGSGKSTVLKSIYGLLTPWKNDDGLSGKIYFEDNNITNIHPSKLLKLGIAYMPQKKNVFEDFTVEENLQIAASIYSKEDAKRRVKYVTQSIPHLVELRKRFPFSMSGGEKQLLAFGCAMLHTPKLMLLDEPFAGVDEKYSKLLLDIVRYIYDKGVTFLIIEHKKFLFETIKYRVIEMELGKIIKNRKI